ncbi:MAG TPA: ATP-binding protein [bacterium]|nr:ATP-binding protein [bacterium]
MTPNTAANNNEIIELELRIKSELQYLSTVRGFIKTVSELNKFSEETVMQITLVLDEAVANIIEHGYKLKNDEEIYIKIIVDLKKINIQITDFSEGFDISKFGNVNIKEHLKNRKNRGLGVYIIKKLMDKVEYERNSASGNRLTLTKFFNPKTAAKNSKIAQTLENA